MKQFFEVDDLFIYLREKEILLVEATSDSYVYLVTGDTSTLERRVREEKLSEHDIAILKDKMQCIVSKKDMHSFKLYNTDLAIEKFDITDDISLLSGLMGDVDEIEAFAGPKCGNTSDMGRWDNFLGTYGDSAYLGNNC